jgi:hypothetical protein
MQLQDPHELPPTEPEEPILHILFGWRAPPKRKIDTSQ